TLFEENWSYGCDNGDFSSGNWSYGSKWNVGSHASPDCYGTSYPNSYFKYNDLCGNYSKSMVSPTIYACCVEDLTLKFCLEHQGSSYGQTQYLKVEISTDGGNNWDLVEVYASNQSGLDGQKVISIPQAENEDFKIRFRATGNVSSYQDGKWGIDNVKVKGEADTNCGNYVCEIAAECSGSDVSVYGGNNGSLSPIISGSNNYEIEWTGPNGFSSNSTNISNLVAGTYMATITDLNGDDCETTIECVVEQPEGEGDYCDHASEDVVLFTEDWSYGSNNGNYSTGTWGYGYKWHVGSHASPDCYGSDSPNAYFKYSQLNGYYNKSMVSPTIHACCVTDL